MLSRQPFVETGDVVEVGYHLGSTAAVTTAIGYAWKRKVTDPRRLRDWQLRTHPFIYTTPRGRTFQLYPDQSIDKYIFVDGAYELRFLRVIERFFRGKPGAVMLDIGANIGNHAIYLSNSFDRIMCFEPSPYIAERLRKNITLNRLTNIEVHTVGLSNREAALHYKLDTSGNLGASQFVSEADEQTIDLPVCRADDYLSTKIVNRVDFIKIDVEHHELEVFEGLELTVSRYRPIIAFEFHGTSLGSSYFDAIAATLPNYIFSEATFAPPFASDREKLLWQIRHRGLPEFERIVVPEARFYESIIAFPDETTFREFAASNNAK
jgi:FkbM family methyltransferase